jgi:hypothetical protein
MPLSRKPAPFDHSEWAFELKYDGFRSLAILQNGRCRLISRNGHSFNSFANLRPSRDLWKGITATIVRAADIALLLVVHRVAFGLFACRIGHARTDGAAFAIGRHDNSTNGSDLAVFLNC